MNKWTPGSLAAGLVSQAGIAWVQNITSVISTKAKTGKQRHNTSETTCPSVIFHQPHASHKLYIRAFNNTLNPQHMLRGVSLSSIRAHPLLVQIMRHHHNVNTSRLVRDWGEGCHYRASGTRMSIDKAHSVIHQTANSLQPLSATREVIGIAYVVLRTI